MPHLTPEALARLVDERPDDSEHLHLASCPECSAELDALVEQRALMASLPDLAPPPDAWPRLRTQLKREGLLRERRAATPMRVRAAAAVVLFIGGGVMGYALRGQVDAVAEADPSGLAVEDMHTGQTTTESPPPESALDVELAGERFMASLDRYMATAGAGPSDPAARLAALDNIVLTTAEALNEAPSDPVINGYHLSALAQRNAVIRQLATGAGDPIF